MTVPVADHEARTGPPDRPRRSRRMVAPLTAAGALGALTMALHLRDPHTSGSWGLCPFRALTGLDCPGCGGLRAVNDLGNLDVVSAASSNLLLVLAIPLLVALWFSWARRAWREGGPPGPPTRHRVLLTQAALVLMVVFTIVRNLPFGGWFAA